MQIENPQAEYRGYVIGCIRVDGTKWQVQSYANAMGLPVIPTDMGRYATFEAAVVAARQRVDSALG